MRRLLILGSCALLLLALPSIGRSAVLLHFKGPIHDRDGKRVAGPLRLSARIYDAPVGGNLIAGPFGPYETSPRAGDYSIDYGPVSLDLLEGGRRWLDLSTGRSEHRRVELEKVFFDAADRAGKLAGGRTLIPWYPDSRARSTTTRAASPSVTILDNGPSDRRIDFVFVGDGYLEQELGAYATHVQNALAHLLSQEPFYSYRTFFNAHRVDVISNESGVDNDPDFGISKDTALDMAFFCGAIERLLCVNVSKAYEQAASAPDVDQVFAIANSEKYGGAGYTFSDLATVAGGNPAAAEVAVHESGHSLGNLADEYDYGDGSTYGGGEPVEPNISKATAAAMRATGLKWARWLGDPGIGYGGLVDTYEGAGTYALGLYRPTADSKMRSLGAPFNLPSMENLILEFYRTVRLLDGASPEGADLTESSIAFIDAATPPGHPLTIQWYLDGVAIPGATGETFEVASGGFELGAYELSVTVSDATPFVRNETARAELMTESRSWPLLINNRRPVVTAPTSVTELENRLISFAVGAADPDGDPIASLVATGTAIEAGATFQEDGSHTSGTFSWTPTIAQSGEYRVTFTATNGLPGRMTTQITVVDTDRAPSVTAPAVVDASEGTTLRIAVSVIDPDGDPIESLTAAGSAIAAGAVFLVSPSRTSATLEWGLNYVQSGSYSATFTAQNARSGSATTEINVANVDQAPEIDALLAQSIKEGSELEFQIAAEDPDGDPIATLTATGSAMAAGASFTADASNHAGEFRWTPDYSMAGEHDVVFSASNALTGSATVTITVANVDRHLVLSAPSVVDGAEGAEVAFEVLAADPDGERTESLRADPLPPGGAFLSNATNDRGTFSWVPDYDQAGSYAITLSAESACRPTGVSGALVCDQSSATVSLSIANTDRAPAVVAPALVAVDENAPVSFAVSASDPDGDGITTLECAPLPLLASFTPGAGNAAGTFDWTPDYTAAGDAPVTFTATNVLSSSATTTIRVRNVNRPPAADAGGPYAGVSGVPIEFAGDRSSDPDGDELAYEWDFGDGAVGSGARSSHAYTSGGSFTVALTVSDTGTPPLSGVAATTATITNVFESRITLADTYRTIRLGSGRPQWCARIEPVAANFDIEDLLPASVELRYGGTSVQALPRRATPIGDQDHNGVDEFEVCFSKEDLRSVFAALPPGRSTVSVELDGRLGGGASIRGTTPVGVLSGSGGHLATLAPQPVTLESMLTLTTKTPGRARVSLFDLQGRYLQTLLDRSDLPAGYHDIRIAVSRGSGQRLPSGVYFYRVEAGGMVETGRFVVAR